MSLLKKTSSGFLWALIDRGGLLIFQFLALIFLSRLVTPHDFGLVAIIAIFINISNVVVDSGMIGSLIKKQDIQLIDYNTLFVYNIVLSSIIYIILFSAAPLIAHFYKTPIIEPLIRVLSLSIVINSFGMVQLVVLTRNLNFKIQSLITLISQIISVSISILIAYLGYGVWALVALQLLQVVFNSTILCFVNRFKPKLEFSFVSFKEQFSFGGPLLISNLLYIFNNNIYSASIGKVFSATESGFFYQSYKLQNTPTGILSAVVDKVGFTVLSKEQNAEKLVFSAHNIYKYIYAITIPFFIYLIGISEKLFLFIFDDKWVQSSGIFKILCLSLIPLMVKILNRNLLKSFGKTRIILIIELITTLVGVLILFCSISINLEGIAYGIFICNLIVSLVSAFFVYKILNYNLFLQLTIIMKPLVSGLIILFFTNFILTCFSLTVIQNMIFNLLLYWSLILFLNFKQIKSHIKK